MKPILMVCANAPAAASASPSAAANAADFAFLMFPPPEKSLPGAVVDRVLERRAGLHQAPAHGPLVGVVEALARVGFGRRVEDARNLEVFGVEQLSRLLDQVARMLAGVLVDRIGGARLGAEHRGEGWPVELVPGRLAAATWPFASASRRSFMVPAKIHLICSRFRKPSRSFSVVKCEPL